jgi:hypothetical protein
MGVRDVERGEEIARCIRDEGGTAERATGLSE